MALDNSTGDVIDTGAGWPDGFPATSDAHQSSCNNTTYDCAFVSKLNNGLTKLLSSTYLGGSRDDNANAVTVDKDGNDYLRTMMDDFSYEVLADVSLLPHRLPQLYRRLTM